MKALTDISPLIQEIKEQEGPDFSCDEELLSQFIQTQQEPEPAISTRVLSVIGGALATLAFTGFLLVVGLYNSTVGLMIFGLAALAGGLIIHQFSKSLMYDSTAISLFLIGYVMFLFGLSSSNFSEQNLAFVSLIIGLASFFISQSAIIAFLGILMACGGLFTFIQMFHAPNLIHVYNLILLIAYYWVAVNEATFFNKTLKTANKYQALLSALILAFIIGLTSIANSFYHGSNPNYFYLTTVANTSAILYCSYFVLNQLQIQHKILPWLIYVLIILLMALSAYTPGISGTLLIVLLSYRTNFKPGLAIGIAAFVYFISNFYYNLNINLLNKSLLLIGSGLLFLALYGLILKLKSNEQD